jgi:environmental stress-induced protein Ves
VSHEPNHPLNRATKRPGQILGLSDYTTSAWSGGSTTELVSYPAGADFSSRQFLWRLSIANVEKDGAFTRFENIQRILMVLKGGINLTHEGEYDCALLPFEQDKFSGNFQTCAKIKQGGATNLNLMLKEGSAGEMLHIALESGQSHSYALVDGVASSEEAHTFSQAVDLLYCVDGEAQIRHSNSPQEFCIHPEESFVFSRNSTGSNGEMLIHNSCNTLANIIAVRIIHT